MKLSSLINLSFKLNFNESQTVNNFILYLFESSHAEKNRYDYIISRERGLKYKFWNYKTW